MYQLITKTFLISLLLLLSACGSIMSSATGQMAKNLSVSIQNHNDPDTVADALPSYLLMIDSFIENDQKNISMLLNGSKLYAAYASIFVNDAERSMRLSQRSLDYATQAACILDEKLCDIQKQPFENFSSSINSLDKTQIEFLFVLGQSWAGWLKAHSADWNAVAQLPRIKLVIEKVLSLDQSYQQGGAHLYMGILYSLLPASMGGKPELARQHFEKSIKMSDSKNLMAKVNFAEHYARLVFDQALHDRLLNEVLSAKAEQPGMTLMNTLAQRKAKELLVSGKEYF